MSGEFSIIFELGRIITNFVDIFAIAQVFERAKNAGKMPVYLRVLAVGIGWSFGHSVTHYFVPLWAARNIEFLVWSSMANDSPMNYND